MGNREDLIRSLAGVMGMSGEAKKADSHFDPATGTLYCGSRVFSQSDITAAKEFCEANMKKMAEIQDNAAMFYEIAASALEILEQDSVKNGGRIVVKDGN
ncbi:MAG: hypothetical protein E7301_11860 [Butyrivibrio sp.]|jgi:hypothetical protein|uniref:hypothetical protein n=1 Tax=Butyrivibrio sp. NC2002 TaxID=1410610 RepID=UPI00055D16A6|nr:hypothetical protein [Butyrivibrio sp. NC2002]MBE5860798.1 hypothetical protein [Butyrivibrio sp.]